MRLASLRLVRLVPGRRSQHQCSSNRSPSAMSWVSRSPLAKAAACLGADEWGLTAEEMDSMERSAAQELAARRMGSPLKMQPELLAKVAEGRGLTQQASVSPLGKRPIRLKVSKEGQGKIAVEAPYNSSLLAAYKSVSGHEWDPSRRLWLFPEHHLQEVIGAVTSTPELVLHIQPVPPLVLPSSVPHFNSASSASPLSTPVKSQLSTPVKSQESSQAGSGPSQDASPSKGIVVQIFLMDENRVAARDPYNENVKQACQSVPGKLWNSEEKVWTFPRSNFMDLVQALRNIIFPRLKIEVVPPLSFDQVYDVRETGCSMAAPSPKADQHDFHTYPAPTAENQPRTARPANLVQHPVQLFLHHSGLLAVKCQPTPKLLAALRSIPKAAWNNKERLWMFPPHFLAEAEKAIAAVNDVVCVVEPLDSLVRRALEVERDVPDFTDKYHTIPCQLESILLPFQRQGVRFGLQHGGRVLIADEMGLGKTVQAIALASCFKEHWPVLVVVPSSLRIHWATMLKTWLGLRARDITVVLSSGSTREGYTILHSAGKGPLQLNGLFNIVSYDILSKLSSDTQFKVVIADESHYMKNAQAKRTNACVPLIQKAFYAILLTGTPALSRPIELFMQLSALRPSVFPDCHEYGRRYCSGSFYGMYQGASNHEELHALLKNTVMIRRLKSEVLSELPEKCREQVFLSLDSKNTRQLRALLNELKTVRASLQSLADDALIESCKKDEKILYTKIYSESAIVKLPAVQDYLSTMLEANCKFLVFAYHHTMMDGIENHLKKKKVEYIRIDGETPPVIRQNLVSKFQESDKVKAAVLSIRAAGVGLTLTAASTVIFAEMSWTPGEMVQAEDRAHRIGQRSSVNVYYLHAHETIDDFIWESVHRKLGNIGQVLDGREERIQVSSPSQLRQRTLNSYLRPCTARNLCEEYDKGGPKTENPGSTSYGVDKEAAQSKRLKISGTERD